jgi:lysophospholipase L1-like esterase
LLALLVGALIAPGSAAADGDGPATGMWSGSADGTTVTFVISHVGGTTVFSDLTMRCDTSWGAASDEGRDFRQEAAIDAGGYIRARVSQERRGYESPDGLSGRLGADHGTVSVDGFYSFGPEGFVGDPDGNGGALCENVKDLSVKHVDAHLMEDGSYAVAGTGGETKVSIYGRGALIEWEGGFRTPIGGDPEDPLVNCAEIPAESIILGWYPMFPSASGTFSGGGFSLWDAASLTGKLIGSDKAAGTWTAITTYPITCTGLGAFTLTLQEPLPDLVPVTPESRDGGHPSPGKPPAHRERMIRYVALGDSYSSGEGVPPYDADSDTKYDKCHRSKGAYSRLLTLPGVRFKRSFFACSGATTADVLHRQYENEPPQITRWQLRKAQLVTISIGGNDAAFSEVVTKCTRGYPAPCWRGRAARKIHQRIASLGPTLTATYRKIRERAPRAKLIVLGYPNLMPKADQTCGKLKALFSTKARKFMRAEGGQLSQVTAAAARHAGVRYLDVRQEFADHEFCAPDEWVHFLVRGKGKEVVSKASFHPTADGQRAYARILQRALR